MIWQQKELLKVTLMRKVLLVNFKNFTWKIRDSFFYKGIVNKNFQMLQVLVLLVLLMYDCL